MAVLKDDIASEPSHPLTETAFVFVDPPRILP